MELVLGRHNGLVIRGKYPRRPRIRREDERKMLETTMRLTSLSNPLHVLRMASMSDKWTVEESQPGIYTIKLFDPHFLFHFMHILGTLVDQRFSLHGMPPASPSSSALTKVRHSVLPYVHFHGELYASGIWRPQSTWTLFDAVLPTILDDCVHYICCCMNHYYGVIPKRVMMPWYSKLRDPSKDPLVLALGLFWARHVFIHHFPAALLKTRDNAIVDTVQFKLAQLVREALSDCFDDPHLHHVYALTLCNMTNRIPTEQKALWHTVAVRMAMMLGVRPVERPTTVEAELANRTWWYLFHADHFLLESGTIPNSILSPRSDDHDAILQLQRPLPCSMDEPDEALGALGWNNILKLWLFRRRLAKEIEQADPSDDAKMISLMQNVRDTMRQWQAELPPELTLTTIGAEDDLIAREVCYVLAMERCTNMSLLMRLFFPTDADLNAQNGKPYALNPWQREAVLSVVDSSIEFVRVRGTLVQFAPCQTWPGEHKRTIEMLISCMKFGDPEITSRCQLCLMRALRVLRQYEELKWQDDICIGMVHQIEQVLTTEINAPPQATSAQGTAIPETLWTDGNLNVLNVASAASIEQTSSSMCDNTSMPVQSYLNPSFMMFDRQLQPRNVSSVPAHRSNDTQEFVFEDVTKFSSSNAF
ncbi:hypothetical protein BC940DRAFT_293209 [Gongronella butleri]|nr:hypothetical protein BC940DRAFT_293209 [Gongronella butleri]